MNHWAQEQTLLAEIWARLYRKTDIKYGADVNPSDIKKAVQSFIIVSITS